jgi:hypothetical protein
MAPIFFNILLRIFSSSMQHCRIASWDLVLDKIFTSNLATYRFKMYHNAINITLMCPANTALQERKTTWWQSSKYSNFGGT